MARRKQENGSDKTLTNLLILGGLMLLNRSTLLSGQAPAAETSIQSVPVSGGERVSADSYRQIARRRAGMDYAYAEGYLGDRIVFDVRQNGVFTRNVVLENGVIFAELKYT